MTDRAAAPLPEHLAMPAAGDVSVWWATVGVDDAALARAARDVDAATLARADRMRREVDQRRILLAHALLRRLLSAVAGTPPAEIVLQRYCANCDSADHGRPLLPGGPSFGLSHGGDVVAVALAGPDDCVAIDVEEIQPAERWEAVRSHAFSDDEWAGTADDPSAGRTALWTRKEAVVKATGHGLSLDLRRVHVAAQDGADDGAPGGGAASPGVVTFDAGEPPAPDGPWLTADVELAFGHRAAIAARLRPAELRIVTRRVAL